MKIKKMTGPAGVLLALGVLITLNLVLRPMRIRVDVTEDKLYTLSDGTKQLLGELGRDVTLKFYFSRSNDRLPVPMKNFASRCRDLLTEYESRSGGYLVVEEYDPRPDSEEEEWAQRYGLQSQSLDMFGMGGSLYFGIVAVSGNREAAIPLLAQSTEPRLEYLLTRLVSEVASGKSAKIGLISALPVSGSPQMNPYMTPQGGGGKWAVLSEIERQYDVEAIAKDTTDIPEDINVLVVIHPAAIPNDTLYAIDQFVLHGGHLLAFTDPMSIAAHESVDPQQIQMGMPLPPESSDLNRLTSAWGIEMVPGMLASDESAASMLNAGGGQVQRNAAWLSLRTVHINREDIVTGSLSDLMLPFAGSFEGSVSNGLEKTELLFTADDGFMIDTFAARSGNFDIPAARKRISLAVRLVGIFPTAFPDGKPSEGEDAEEKGLEKSEKPSVVILVADTDMLANRFATQSMNLFGQSLIQPRNDNLAFAVNMVEQLCGSDALIGLRSRNSFARPFDRVVDMEKEAAFKWQAEEQRLNEKLQTTQARLSQIQQVRDDGQQMFFTPEQEAEIKKFREEVFKTRQSLKDVRKRLRRDIEMLGARLKAINIMGIPLLFAAFGIGRGIWLKKKR